MLLEKRWSLWRRLAAMIVGTVVVAGALSACELSVPKVVGLALPEAVSKLEGSGYRHVAVVDEFGTTIEESHYEDGFKVTAQDAVGEGVSTSSTITLTVAESAVASLVMTPDESPSPRRRPSPRRLPNLSRLRRSPRRPRTLLRSRRSPPLRLPRRSPFALPRRCIRAARRLARRGPHPSTRATPVTTRAWTATRTAWPASSGPSRRFRSPSGAQSASLSPGLASPAPRPRLHEVGASSCASAWRRAGSHPGVGASLLPRVGRGRPSGRSHEERSRSASKFRARSRRALSTNDTVTAPTTSNRPTSALTHLCRALLERTAHPNLF